MQKLITSVLEKGIKRKEKMGWKYFTNKTIFRPLFLHFCLFNPFERPNRNWQQLDSDRGSAFKRLVAKDVLPVIFSNIGPRVWGNILGGWRKHVSKRYIPIENFIFRAMRFYDDPQSENHFSISVVWPGNDF